MVLAQNRVFFLFGFQREAIPDGELFMQNKTSSAICEKWWVLLYETRNAYIAFPYKYRLAFMYYIDTRVLYIIQQHKLVNLFGFIAGCKRSQQHTHISYDQ